MWASPSGGPIYIYIYTHTYTHIYIWPILQNRCKLLSHNQKAFKYSNLRCLLRSFYYLLNPAIIFKILVGLIYNHHLLCTFSWEVPRVGYRLNFIDSDSFRFPVSIPMWLNNDIKHLSCVSFLQTIYWSWIPWTKINRLHKNGTL